MNEQEILDRWAREEPSFRAWAVVVKEEICRELAASLHPNVLDSFLKVEPRPRLKDARSLVDKALYRGKNYEDPYQAITDKAGLRFVVLLTSQIDEVERIICGSTLWTCSKDRDYESERVLRPQEFGYQSVHYVITCDQDRTVDAVAISRGTTCEVQVRTLLQHAHSELTHDSIYKGKKAPTANVSRVVAKTMALIEVVDDFFESVTRDLRDASAPARGNWEVLQAAYVAATSRSGESQASNYLILDAFGSLIPADFRAILDAFLAQNGFVTDIIKERAPRQHLFRQPAILLAYWVVHQSPNRAKEMWPLTADELRPIFGDLGKSMDN